MISAIRPVKPDLGEPSAVLVRTPNWLGDLMMSTAFLRALLARFPRARVDLIVRRGFEPLPLPHRGRIHAFDKRAMASGAFGREFKDRGHSHMFVLPPSLSSAWMACRTGIPWRIGHPGQMRTFLLAQIVPSTPVRQVDVSLVGVREAISHVAVPGNRLWSDIERLIFNEACPLPFFLNVSGLPARRRVIGSALQRPR